MSYEISTKLGEKTVKPVTWLMSHVTLTWEGIDYPFWFEYDSRDGSSTLEFLDEEPCDDFDNFDYVAFEQHCLNLVLASQEASS